MRLLKKDAVIIALFVGTLLAVMQAWLQLSLVLGVWLLVLMVGMLLRFLFLIKVVREAPLKKRLTVVFTSVSLLYAVGLYLAFTLLYQIILTLTL